MITGKRPDEFQLLFPSLVKVKVSASLCRVLLVSCSEPDVLEGWGKSSRSAVRPDTLRVQQGVWTRRYHYFLRSAGSRLGDFMMRSSCSLQKAHGCKTCRIQSTAVRLFVLVHILLDSTGCLFQLQPKPQQQTGCLSSLFSQVRQRRGSLRETRLRDVYLGGGFLCQLGAFGPTSSPCVHLQRRTGRTVQGHAALRWLHLTLVEDRMVHRGPPCNEPHQEMPGAAADGSFNSCSPLGFQSPVSGTFFSASMAALP